MSLIPVPKDLIFKSPDSHDPRLGELVQFTVPHQLQSNSFCLIGYPDDEGIRLNGGRAGAKDAPHLIRQFLFKMTPDILKKEIPRLFDVGNLQPQSSLEKTHALALDYTKQIMEKSTLLSLGGGHDFGFPDAAAFLESNKDKNPLILNFDAHLDVRPTNRGFHSGTPFRRLIEKYHGKFELVEIGIQPQCNSQAHLEWATEKGIKVIFIDEIQRKGLRHVLSDGLKPDPQRPLWISLDIDAFSSNEAPGCSQSWATGLNIQEFLPALEWLCQSYSCRGMGIYEVSPPLDEDNRTSKLAALILHRFMSFK